LVTKGTNLALIMSHHHIC